MHRNVEVTRRIHHGSNIHVPGAIVYVDEHIAKAWVALGAAKMVQELPDRPKRVVEKAVNTSPVPLGQKVEQGDKS